jgi:acyl-coenzyme A thioesterase PaaI-like protein
MTTTVEEGAGPLARKHVLHDLGWQVTRVGDQMEGSATVVPEMFVPGTEHLRVSILTAWADVLAGYLAIYSVGPRVPVTLELDVHLYAPISGVGGVRGVAEAVKIGRSVFVARVDFTADDGSPLGFAGLSFMAAPDKRLTIEIPAEGDALVLERGRLLVPWAERAGCARREPGVAVLGHSEEVLNASNTLNGGLIALAVEEAVLSLSPDATLSSLALRYLQPARVGPAVATATVRNGLGEVEVRDAGNDNRLCVVATSRTFAEETTKRHHTEGAP